MMPDFGPPPARARYVPNDIGPSPENWLAPRLEQVSTLITNGFVGTATPFYTDHTGVKYLYGQNVRQNYVDEAGIRYITKSFHDDQSKTRLRTGDILTVQSGHIGVTAVVPPSLDGANCHALIVTRLRKQYANPDFVSQYLNSEIGKARLRGLEVGSTILHINTKDLKKFRIPLPALAEQERIVDFLKTWDRAIETVDALIANARAQKQALMQQLLPQGTTPPKKRLPGFSGEWKRVALADIGTISSAGVDKNIVEGEAEVRLLNFLDAYNREFIYDSDLDHRVTAPPAKVQGCNVHKGDVFFTPSSETRDDIALAAVAAEDMPGVVYSYHVVRFRPTKKLDLKFCAFLFQTDDFKRQAYRLGDGSGQRYVISQSNFRKMLVSLPRIDEQAAIGELLAGHSRAVADYESQLSALRQEKAALMQQLLTGKRRVKLPESEVA